MIGAGGRFLLLTRVGDTGGGADGRGRTISSSVLGGG